MKKKVRKKKPKEPYISPKCYKCDTLATEVIPLSRITNLASFEGYCPKCKARLSWTCTYEDGIETWEFLWVKRRKENEGE